MSERSIVPDKCKTIARVWKDGVDNELISVETRLTEVEDDIRSLGAFEFDSDLNLIKHDIVTNKDKNDEQDGILINIITNVETKADKSYVDGKLALKVDKVSGKGLSDTNYTSEEKSKLSNIEANANNYTHPATHPASMIVESTAKRFVSDTQISGWNEIPTNLNLGLKADKNYVDTELDGKLNLTGGTLTGRLYGTFGSFTELYTTGGIVRISPTITNDTYIDLLAESSSPSNSKLSVVTRRGGPKRIYVFSVNSDGDVSYTTTFMRAEPGTSDVVNYRRLLDAYDEMVGYVDDRVKTPVPTNAKFTDTVVDISGKADRTYVDDKLSDKADKTEVLFKTSQSLTTTEKNQVKSNLDILKTWVGLEEDKGTDPNTIYYCIEE